MSGATWSCDCGLVEARVPTQGARLVCYCQSCRAFAVRLGHEERLDAAGGSDLLQVSPDKVAFLKGAGNLRYMRITENGPLRWYANCCKTPMANTLPTRAVAFASFQVRDIVPKEALPDIGARVHLKGATAPVDAPRGSVRPFVLRLVAGTLRAWFSGGWRRNPFFDASGKPVGARIDP